MSKDWARLGAAVTSARRTAGMSQQELAERIGTGRSSVQSIERGHEFAKITGTMRSVARELGWADGSIESVLAGGDPVPADTAPTPPSAGTGQDLPLRIVQELSEGQLLDTTVLDLTPAGSSARMIVVVKGRPDASPEEIRRDLLAWRKMQRRLQNIGDEEEPPAARNA